MHALPPNQLSLWIHNYKSNRRQLQPRRPALCKCNCNPSISVNIELLSLKYTTDTPTNAIPFPADFARQEKKYIKLAQNTRYAMSEITLCIKLYFSLCYFQSPSPSLNARTR